MDREVPVAEMKAHLSEYVAISHRECKRIVITKRGKRVAALVNIEDFEMLEQLNQKQGLAEIAGKWEDFKEVAESIDKAYQSRNQDKHRHVSI